ncbi:MAG: hypothetical protein Q7T55_10960 [Solirubrobacteraceae bacterium]|nr:hypothetical protein [Solirubrobacteraceae bacterium]
MIGLRRAAAAGGAVFALAGSAFAADQIVGRDRAPAAATVTINASAPLFQAEGLVNGQVLDRCTVLTNEGPQPADVTLFGSASQADLSPWLDLELVRGTLPDDTTAGDCTGFTADPVDYGAGQDGVVFRGTLDALPNADDGIADPTRWAVGERHAYLLRIHYTGDDPQQGLTTVQSFNWGATPFDDRPADPYVEPAPDPTTPGGASGFGGSSTPAPPSQTTTPPATIRLERQCNVITFPTRAYIGARAISRVTKVKTGSSSAKGEKQELSGSGAVQQPLSSSTDSVVSALEEENVGPAELERRQDLLASTRRTGTGSTARRSPVLVVRLSPGKDDTIAVRVGLRKNAKMTSPKRWRWVRFRLNSSPTKSTLKWPFTATAKMGQLKTGYNQIDLTLNRGASEERLEGLPQLLRRSFAFMVGEPKGTTGTGTVADCSLG